MIKTVVGVSALAIVAGSPVMGLAMQTEAERFSTGSDDFAQAGSRDSAGPDMSAQDNSPPRSGRASEPLGGGAGAPTAPNPRAPSPRTTERQGDHASAANGDHAAEQTGARDGSHSSPDRHGAASVPSTRRADNENDATSRSTGAATGAGGTADAALRAAQTTPANRTIAHRAWPERNRTTLIAGCPPGLADHDAGCVTRPQAHTFSRGWWGLGGEDVKSEDRFVYRGGYLLRVGQHGRATSHIPLLCGALSVGYGWPADYPRTTLPDYIVSYFDLGSRDSYRLANDVIYRVDPQTEAITSIAALLAADDFVVGERAPPGYRIRNIPLAYREQFRDGPKAHYRYSDGHIYRIDPLTRVVRESIALIAS